VASLSVIQGADQGKRFEFTSSPLALGRDSSNAIRLQDTEISRRHAEFRRESDGYCVVDLHSANGTFVNGKPVDHYLLHSGDRIQLGQTVMLFHEGSGAARSDLTARVDLLAKSSPDDRSAILKSMPSDEGSRVLKAPDATAGWLRERLLNLSVMYRATQAISDVLDIDALTPLILDLVFESIGADRGAILLKDESGLLLPKAVRWHDGAQPDDRMSISQTIVDYVLEQGQGVITSDAPTDKRFSTAQSVVDLQIREAICVPIRGRHTTLGVIYADIQAGGGSSSKGARSGRFSQEQLTLMVAIGHQAGLAIENTVFYNEKIQAERLAAIGQTIATLSHHIKNILQGIHGGSSLIDLGLKEKDDGAGISSRRTRPRSTTWSWTCSHSPRIASRRSSRLT
jgi:pSer/pThr/pTyr-binding forkhead associated (FHA) protein